MNMISPPEGEIMFKELTRETAAQLLLAEGAESAVGHADTAVLLTSELGVEIPYARTSLTDVRRALVCQYTGPRLPEGTKVLPEGAGFRYLLIEVRASA